ncbi:hypothetical protein IW150_004354 [Coemansia sp. RSA 2607]|nr:hypothetical protein IW150_004354 [Coemansia sp. RSA 2607]
MSRKGTCGRDSRQNLPTFRLCPLWEISSPNPAVFPMHCRDARGLIDPVPLTTMVLDRHQFCFRFLLCGNRMRWQVTSKEGSQRIELQCFVRSTMVAMLICTLDNLEGNWPMHDAFCSGNRGEADRMSVWNSRRCTSSLQYSTSDSRGSKLPSIVILPMAFGQMPEVDTAVVESFVLFTGIEVLERFICSGNIWI